MKNINLGKLTRILLAISVIMFPIGIGLAFAGSGWWCLLFAIPLFLGFGVGIINYDEWGGY